MKMKTILLGLTMTMSLTAMAQPNINAGKINATQGFQVNGAAPNNQILCGNGTVAVFATNCGASQTLYYQTIQQGGSNLPQRGRSNFDPVNFVFVDNSGNNSTDVALAGTQPINITGNANTATNATNATHANSSAALDGSPSNCSGTNSYATGIQANGNANCATVTTTPIGGGFADVTGSRSLSSVYQNTTASIMRVDANFVTSGSQAYNLRCDIGSTGGLGFNVFTQQTGASTNGYGAHADCMVPAGWFYSISYSSTGGTFSKTSWYETTLN